MKVYTLSEWNNRKKKKDEVKESGELKVYSYDEWAEKKGVQPITSSKKDDDIAPVRKHGGTSGMLGAKKDSEERTWFNSGRFDDGYQFGDVTKTILGSVGDLVEDAGAGIMGMGEKAFDAMMFAAPYVNQGQFYQNGGAYAPLEVQKVQNKAFEESKKGSAEFIKKDLYDEQKIAQAIISAPIRETTGFDIEEASVFGEKTDSLAQSGGQLLATAGLQAVGVPWFLTTGATSFGAEAENALNQGATMEEAGLSAAVSAGAEILTEKLSGGIKFGGKTADDFIIKPLTEKISSKALRVLTNLGIDAAGEGFEEVASSVISNLGTSLYKEENIGELLASEEAIDEYIDSFVGGAILGGVSSGIGTVKDAVGTKTEFTENEQKVIDFEVEKRISEKETDGKKLTQREISSIEEQVKKELDRGYISIDSIESALGGETYDIYKRVNEHTESLQKEYDELNKLKTGEMTGEQIDRKAEIKRILDDFKEKTISDRLKQKLHDDVYNIAKSDRLAESYNEERRKGEQYNDDPARYKSEAARQTVQNVINSGLVQNTNKAHDFIDFMAKISEDKGYVFDVTTSERLAESKANSNPYNLEADPEKIQAFVSGKDKKIFVNLDANKSLNSLVGHEITHTLEANDGYEGFQKVLFDYAATKGELKDRIASLKKRYDGLDVDTKMELTAELVGDYLFTDSDFIRELSVKDRNIFQKIYDEIKYLCKLATAGSREARELEKVKKEFAKLYRETSEASEISDTDTSYSLADSDGNELSKGQQEYFKDSKVRDENGNLKVMFHGTPNGDFTVFKDGTYFTGNREYADRYQSPSASSISTGKTATNPKTFAVYLNITKPFDISDPEARDIYINEYIKGGNAMGINPYLSDAEYAQIKAVDWTEGEDLREFLIDNGYDYDGLILDEGADGGYGDDVAYRGESYVVFSPEQIKNIDNKKPTADSDIRFSLAENVEETKDLVAVHNLSGEKLLKSLKLGGLPMPSVAIAKAKDGHSEFGEISLVFSKDAIDPKANSRNKVYSGDAWTPTYPTVEYKPNDAVRRKMEDKIRKLIPYEVQHELGNIMLDSDNIRDMLNRYDGDMVDAFKSNDSMKYAYLLDTGTVIELPKKEANLYRYGEASNEAVRYFSGKLNGGLQAIETYRNMGARNMLQDKALCEAVADALNFDVLRTLEPNSPEYLAYERNPVFSADNIAFRDIDGFLEASRKLLTKGVQQSVDSKAARELIRNAVNQTAYERWLNEQFSGIVEKEGIRNNKDTFTPSGNRRSFEALHYEHNLENVIKAMRETGEKGIGGFGGGNIFGASTREFSTIDELKKSTDKLKNLPEEKFSEIKKGFSERFLELASTLPNRKDSFSATDDAANMMIEAISKYSTRSGIANYIKRESQGWATYSDDVVDKLMELVNDIRNMPTGYFEAKPQRAVSLDEVGVFIIPNNADVKLKQELLNRGYSIAEYDPDVEGSRTKVLNQFEEYKFSLSDAGKRKEYGNYNVYGKDIRFEAPVKGTETETQIPAESFKMVDDYGPITEKEANELARRQEEEHYFLDDMAPEAEELYNGEFADHVKPVDPFAEKDIWEPAEYVPAETAPTAEYEAIRPKPERTAKEPRMARVKEDGTPKAAPGKNLRSWPTTSTESEAVDGKVVLDDLDQDVIHYQPISNQKTLGNANAKLGSMGYETSVQYFNSQFENRRVTLDDVALGERLIQEAVKNGDYKTAGDLIQNVSILGTELGQKVQALSIIKRLTPEGQLQMLQKVVKRGKAKGDKAYDGVEITQEMIDYILSTYGKDGSYDQNKLNEAVEKVKKQIADQMQVSKLDKVNAWRYLSMLGNPKTHIRNLVSNVAMRGTVAAKNAVARTIETVAPVKERTKTWKASTDAVKKFADTTTTEMKDVITGDSKYSNDATIKQKREIFKNKILNGVYEFNSDMLEKEDWWFSKPAFKNSLAEYLTANGIKTEQDIKNNPEVVEKAKNYALEQSQIATFRQYSWLANKIQDIERHNTATNIAVGAILPFKKTPINVAKAGLNYSPLGFMKTLTYDVAEVKKGNMQSSELVDHLAQNITGSALALAGYMLARSGFLSGGGEDDKEGKYDYQLGTQAYAINIDGKSYSLSWLSPVAMPLFVGANAYEQLVEGKEWNGDVVVETLAQTLDPLSEMSFLSSLDDVLSSYDSGIQKFAGIAESAAQNYLTQFVPTLSSQVATVMDDKKRSTKVAGDSEFKFVDETINKLIYKIPGLRETLEPSTDIWGNEVKQTENVFARALETFIAPYSKRDDIATEIDSELKAVYGETGENSIIPSVPYNYTNYDSVKYEMSTKEYTDFKKLYGQTANNLLGDLFDTRTYQAAGADEKADLIGEVYDYARDEAKRKLLKKHGVEYTNATKEGKEYYKENPIKGAIEKDLPLDEYKFSIEYPEKYDFFKSINVSYNDYKSADKDTKEVYNWAFDNPEKYTVSKAVTSNVVQYRKFTIDLYDIRADKDSDGDSIPGSAKEKKIDYINNLDLDYGQRLILFRSLYDGEEDKQTYNGEILDYLNSRSDLTYDEIVTILEELDFKVYDDGRVEW